MRDPKRLLDDPRMDPIGRTLLENRLDPGPTDAAVEALWRSIGLHVPPPGCAATASISKLGKPGKLARVARWARADALAKAVAIVAVGTAAVLTVVSHRARSHASVGGVASTPPGSAPSTSALAWSPAPLAPTTPPDALVTPSEASPRPRPSSLSPSVAVRPKARVGTLGAETEVVLRSRRDLRDGDCTGALTLLDDVQRRFGAGDLGEEREALAIEALACVGRSADASRRAAAFVLAHPESIHAAAVERWIVGP
jgi:hypothetical protein